MKKSIKIADIDTRFKSSSKGKALDKQNAQGDVIDTLLKIAGVLYVLGKNQKNENLKALSSVTVSGLKKMRDNDILLKAKNILQNAKSNQAALKNLDTDIDADVAELDAGITNYENAMNTKEVKTTESHASREALNTAFIKADDILNEELDNLMEVIRKKIPDLYNQYKSARNIKDLGIRKSKTSEPKPTNQTIPQTN